MKTRARRISAILSACVLTVSLSCTGVMAGNNNMIVEDVEEMETEDVILEEEGDAAAVEIFPEEEVLPENDEVQESDFSDEWEETAVCAANQAMNSATSMKVAPNTDQGIRDDYTVYDFVDGNHVWRKFTTSANDSFYYIHVKNIDVGAYGAYIHLKTQHNETVWEALNMGGSGAKAYTWMKLKPNTTYYFECYTKNKVSGNIAIYVAESKDDEPDAMTKAKSCKLGTLCTGSLDGQGDIDWFSFSTGSYDSGDYELNVACSDEMPELCSSSEPYGFWFDLYDMKSNKIAKVSNIPLGETGKAKVELKPNTTYFLKVHPGDKTALFGQSKIFGNYQFSLKCTSADKKYDLSNAEITIDKEVYTYSESAILKKPKANKPKVKKVTITVKDGKKTKKVTISSSKYSVSYEDNTEPGTAKVIITGKKDAYGTASKFFYIKPITPSPSLSNGKKSFTISWKKIPKATSYEVRYAKKKGQLQDAEVKEVKTVEDDELLTGKKKITIKSLAQKTKYYVQVRSYANGQYSPWSTTKSVTTK